MKVLMINGSPREGGNTSIMLDAIADVLHRENIETEVMQIGKEDIRGCIACGQCMKTGKCVFDDIVNVAADKVKESDGLILGSPVYYAGINGSLKSFLDRVFYRGINCGGKVGTAIAVSRRAGNETALDQMYKILFYNRFIIVGSQYWNGAYGQTPGQVLEDKEGMQIMTTLAENFAFALKSVELGKERYGVPQQAPKQKTNFIR